MNSRMMDDINSAGDNIPASNILDKIKKLMEFEYEIIFKDNSFKIYKNKTLYNNIRNPFILTPNEPIQRDWDYTPNITYKSINSTSNKFESEIYDIDNMFFYCDINEFDSKADSIIERETKKRKEDKQREIESIVKQIKEMEERLEKLKNKLECAK